MHGLLLKAFEAFVIDRFGMACWQAMIGRAELAEVVEPEGFDMLAHYPADVAPKLLSAAVTETGLPGEQVLEDLGTWLISSPRNESLRRLMRFGGLTFADFLTSLDDLQGRAQLAIPDLVLPPVEVRPQGQGRYLILCRNCPCGFISVLAGFLRALADDYGALVVLEPLNDCLPVGAKDFSVAMGTTFAKAKVTEGEESALPDEGQLLPRLRVTIHDPAFHQGRQFDLAVWEGR